MARNRFRDPSLLDALEALEATELATSLWRVSREIRDPCQCSKGGGRWDDTTFDVRYTSALEEGAMAKMYFHLRRGQPVVPSKPVYRLYELKYAADNLLDLTDPDILASVGIDMSVFGKLGYGNRSLEYQQSQAIGEAANYLGFDGIIVPNARWDTTNIVVFCDQSTAELADDSHDGKIIDWNAWRERTGVS